MTDRLLGTVGAALAEAVERLRASGSPSPRLDAEVLLAHISDRDRSWLLAHGEAALDDVVDRAFRAAVRRRMTGEPVAYIRGFKDWHSLRIRTDARALVPRPETEGLAEAAVADIEARLARQGCGSRPVVVWEVATGSGAVAVALGLRFRAALDAGKLMLLASDVSSDALELAMENLAEHGVSGFVTLLHADLLTASGGWSLPRPDVVVANLPYLSTAEVDAAAGSLAHEPRVALEAGSDGLRLLRRLFAELPAKAPRGATVLLEVALGQADAVAALAPATATADAMHDLSGVPRVLVVRLAA